MFHTIFDDSISEREYIMARVISILRNPNFSSKSLLEPLSKRSDVSIFRDKSKIFFDEVLLRMREDDS